MLGLLIFILYMAVAAAITYGAIVVIHDVRKHNDEFLGGKWGYDYQCVVAVIIAALWPIAAPIGFAVLFAYKKIVEEENKA